MAKEEILSSIQQDVNKISKQYETKFGPKLPDGDRSTNTQDSIEENTVSLLDVICGSLGQMVWGEANVDYRKLMTKTNEKKNTIFSNIATIANLANELNAKVTIAVKAFKNFDLNNNEFKRTISDLLKDSIIQGINGSQIVQIANTESSGSAGDQIAKQNKIVVELIGSTETVESLIDVLKTLEHDNLISSVGNISSILSEIRVLTDKDGELYKLVENLADLSRSMPHIKNGKFDDNTDLGKAINGISMLIKSFTDVRSLGLKQVIIYKKNLFYIRTLLVDSIKSFINKLSSDINVDNRKIVAINTSISVINNIIVAITNIANLGLFKILKARLNFILLEHFIENSITSLLKTIQSTFNQFKDNNLKNKVNAIGSLFNLILSIGVKNEKTNLKNQIAIASNNIDDFIDLVNDKMTELIKSINELASLVATNDLKNVNNFIKSSNDMLTLLPGFKTLFLSNLKIGIYKQTIDILLASIVNINKTRINKNISQKYDAIETYIEKALNFSEKLSNVHDLPNYKEIINFNEKLITIINSIYALEKVGKKLRKVKNLKGIEKIADLTENAYQKFSNMNIDTKNIELILDNIKQFTKVVAIAGAVVFFGALLFKFIEWEDAFKFITFTRIFIGGMIGLLKLSLVENADNLEKILTGMHSFGQLIAISGFILIIGSLFMKVINPANLIVFTVTLGLFIAGTLYAVSLASKHIEKALGDMEKFAMFIGITGAVLIYGSLLFMLVDWKSALLFVTSTALFIFLSLSAVILASKLKAEAMNDIIDFGIFIALCGFTVMIGSLMFTMVNWKSALGFVAAMAGFMLALLGVFWLIDKIGGKKGNPLKEAMKGAKDFAILVAACGLVLILAGMLIKMIDIGGLALFALTLAGFMLAVMAPYIFFKATGMIEMSMKSAKAFGLLLFISAGILIMGGLLLTLYPQIIPGLVLFTLVFGGFMFAMSFIVKQIGKTFTGANGKNAFLGLFAMGLFVAISGALLLYAANVIGSDLSKIAGILVFTFAALLLIGGVSFICYGVGEEIEKIKKGIPGLLAVVVAIGITSLAIKELAKASAMIDGVGGVFKFGIVCAAVVGMLYLVGSVAVSLGLALGNPGSAAFAYTAIGVILAVAGAIWIVSHAMVNVADSIDKLSKIENFDATKIANSLGSLISLIDSLGKISLRAPIIISASAALYALAETMSKISQAVQDYAELKVPIYTGTKLTGYRQLTETDFTNAANNVKKIITVLGYAIIDTYEENKHTGIFDTDWWSGKTKFSIVATSLKTLAPLISSIAKSVQTYASLKVPTGWKTDKNGFATPTGYREMSPGDFEAAGKNVSLIVTTLGKAVIAAYDMKPEIFETNIFGKSKFAKVTKSLKTLAPLISSIAKAVQTYASLSIPTKWEWDSENNRLIGKDYVPMKDQHFEDASKNVQKILKTLGGAIIATYDSNPEMYETKGLFGNSKFSKVISANMKLGTLISKISKAVANAANLVYSDEYTVGKDGEPVPKNFKSFTETDFENAAKNVYKVMTTLGEPIKKIAASKDYELYETFGGVFSKKSKFTNVINGNIRLSKLIDSISKAVKNVANLKIAKYGANGKITGYESVTESHFRSAAQNVLRIITTLGNPIKELAKSPDYDDIYGHPGLWGRIVEGKSTSRFVNVIQANIKLAELIEKIAKGVKDYAQLQIPVFDKDGKVVKNRPMTPTDFDNAAKAIKNIITTLGRSIMETYDAHKKDWFDKDSLFENVVKSITGLGDLLASISKGLVMYSQLKIPTKYDDKGNAIEFVDLSNANTLDGVNENIKRVISTLFWSVIDAWNESGHAGDMPLKDWFKGGKDSIFSNIVAAVSSVGTLIGSISGNIVAIADLKIPKEFDKDGKATSFENIDSTQIIMKAGNNISEILVSFAKAVINTMDGKTYDGNDIANFNKEVFNRMFINGDQKEINNLVSAYSSIGNLIGSISGAIQGYASLSIPTGFDKNGKPTGYQGLDKADFKKAAQHISDILTTIGGAIMNTFNNKNGLFNIGNYNTETSWFLGLVKTKPAKPNDPPFVIIMNSLQNMGAGILSIAEAISKISKLDFTDASGNSVHALSLKPGSFKSAAQNIGDILTTIGGAVQQVSQNPMFHNGSAEKVFNCVGKVGNIVSSIARAVFNFSNMLIYDIETGEDGKIKFVNFRKLEMQDYANAAVSIDLIMSTIMKSVIDTSKGPYFVKQSVESVESVIKLYSKIIPVISNIADVVKKFSSMFVPTEVDPKTGKPTKYERLVDTTTASENIQKLIVAIGQGIVGAVGDEKNQKIFGPTFQGNPESSPAFIVASSISKLTIPLATLGNVIGMYAKNQFPIWAYDKQSKTNIMREPVSLDNNDFANASKNITKMFKSILEPIQGIIDEKQFDKVFSRETNNENSITTAIANISNRLNAIVQSAMKFKNIKFDGNMPQLIGIITNNISSLLLKFVNFWAFLNQKSFKIPLKEKGQVFQINGTISKIFEEDSTVMSSVVGHLVTLEANFASLLDYMTSMNDTFEKNKKLIDIINNDDNNIFNRFSDATIKFIESIAVINEKALSDDIFKSNDIETKLQNINNLSLTVVESFGHINTIYELYESNIKKHVANTDSINAVFTSFADILTKYINSVKAWETVNGDSFNTLVNGILTFNNVVQSFSNEDNYEQNVKLLERYVSTINKIDLSKIIQLNSLANSLNILATKMGNLDNLTETLAKKIAVVLNKLVSELQQAEQTIKNAEQLQKTRHELINKSVEKVKELMSQKMTVEVRKVDDMTPLTEDTSTTPGTTTNQTGGNDQPLPSLDANVPIDAKRAEEDKKIKKIAESKGKSSPINTDIGAILGNYFESEWQKVLRQPYRKG